VAGQIGVVSQARDVSVGVHHQFFVVSRSGHDTAGAERSHRAHERDRGDRVDGQGTIRGRTSRCSFESARGQRFSTAREIRKASPTNSFVVYCPRSKA
jgi:hypothetical protein